MSNSLKSNFLFNLINTVAGLLFPLITFPYASRILLAYGIGQVNFYQSIIAYIILLSSIGIPLYAIREIARVKEDKKLMNITTVEILLLHFALSLVGYLIVVILCLYIEEIQADIPLFLVLSASILFTTIGCEWFYQGIEDFEYIAIRSLIIKCLYVILLFGLVKNKDDLLIYGALTIMGTVGNNVFNFVRLKKYVNKQLFEFRDLHPIRHFMPALKIFVLNLVISLYVNLNPVMLGFMSDATAVGYFTAASKISHILLSISLALQNVVLPRASHLIKVGDYISFKQLAQKIMDFIFLVTLPLSVFLAFLSTPLMDFLCGESYRPAALSLAIQSPIIFIISLSGLFGIQMLYPQGKVRIVIIATSLGAIINIILNFMIIPIWGVDGASLSTLAAEITVTGTMAYLGKAFLPLDRFNRHCADCVIGCIFIGVVCFVSDKIIDGELFKLMIAMLLSVILYMSWLIYRKNEMTKYICIVVRNLIIR